MTQLWDATRIQDEVTALDDLRHIHLESRNHMVQLLSKMRDQYERALADHKAVIVKQSERIQLQEAKIAALHEEVTMLYRDRN